MNKLMAISMFTFVSIAQAGTMGQTSPLVTPYLGLEGSYTWNQIGIRYLNNYQTPVSKNGWGGRLSAGVTRSYKERFSLMAELGGGYYGHTRTSLVAGGMSNTTNSIDGYDFLIGGIYHLDHFRLVGGAGFMVQNNRYKLTINRAETVPGGNVVGLTIIEENSTQVLPELKIGGIYNVYQNIDLSLTYMHVFGSSLEAQTNQLVTSTISFKNSLANFQNPTLDSVLLGLRYNFV
ncbi:MAG: hypothetical protein Q8R83_00190 [Legionellaceae bacterium]|nr:hypothetical protein [Legionellaceae bacterium]